MPLAPSIALEATDMQTATFPTRDRVVRSTTGHRPSRLPASPVRVVRPTPARIPATLWTVRTVRDPRGARELIARLTTTEPVSVRSRLTRGKRMIGGGRSLLVAGTHEVRLKVSGEALGGEGKLTLVLTDQAGHRRTLTTPVTVPMAAS
jgi:hypothetical protein